jgi:Short C-terminal domain
MVLASVSDVIENLAVGIAIGVVLLATVFALWDLAHRHDVHGWAKAGWFLLALIPLIGPAIYVAYRPVQPADIARIDAEAEREQAHATAESLHKLADLHDRGKISDDEYETQKARLLRS